MLMLAGSVPVVGPAVFRWPWDNWFEGVIRDSLVALVGKTWDQIVAAFNSSLTVLTPAKWNVATSLTGKLAFALGVVAVGLCVFEVLRAVMARSWLRLIRAVLLLVFAWPVTAVVVWLSIRLVGGFDQLTLVVLGDAGSSEQIAEGILTPMFKAFGMVRDVAGGTGAFMIGGAAELGEMVIALLLALVMWILSMLLTVVMAFRAFGLLVLMAGAPVVFMVQPFGGPVRELAVKWAKMTVALILTKLMASVVVHIAAGLMLLTDGAGALPMGLAGLVVACAAPKLTAQMVDFAHGGLVTTQGAGGVVRGVTRTGSQMLLGGLRSAGGKTSAVKSLRTTAKTSPMVSTAGGGAGLNGLVGSPGDGVGGKTGASAGRSGASSTGQQTAAGYSPAGGLDTAATAGVDKGISSFVQAGAPGDGSKTRTGSKTGGRGVRQGGASNRGGSNRAGAGVSSAVQTGGDLGPVSTGGGAGLDRLVNAPGDGSNTRTGGKTGGRGVRQGGATHRGGSNRAGAGVSSAVQAGGDLGPVSTGGGAGLDRLVNAPGTDSSTRTGGGSAGGGLIPGLEDDPAAQAFGAIQTGSVGRRGSSLGKSGATPGRWSWRGEAAVSGDGAGETGGVSVQGQTGGMRRVSSQVKRQSAGVDAVDATGLVGFDRVDGGFDVGADRRDGWRLG